MNLLPLLSLPKASIEFGKGNQEQLRTLRSLARPMDGFFLLRYHHLKVPVGTFTLKGGIDYVGRWLLGRIRQHKTQPGRYEIVVWRGKTCYYLAVDSKADLANELRFMAEDADGDLSEALSSSSPWDVVSDPEFTDLGFNSWG